MKNNQLVKTSRKKGILTFLLFFLVTFLVAITAMTFLLFPNFEKFRKEVAGKEVFSPPAVNLMDEMPKMTTSVSPYKEEFDKANRINVLLFGLNQNLADTIMLASFDYDKKHVDLISIPRDTYIFREEYASSPTYLKLNSVYQATDSPLETAIFVSETLRGMPIHCYIKVDYEGIEKIVDIMGGVPIDVPFDMKYYDPDDKPPLRIDIKKGEQVLDGEHAVQYLRYRKGNNGKGYKEGDLGRVKAQQEFMKSAFRQMIKTNIIKNAKCIFENVESDIDVGLVAKIATKAIGMSPDSIDTQTMPNIPDNKSPYYVYPDEKGVDIMVREIYGIQEPADDIEIDEKDVEKYEAAKKGLPASSLKDNDKVVYSNKKNRND